MASEPITNVFEDPKSTALASSMIADDTEKSESGAIDDGVDSVSVSRSDEPKKVFLTGWRLYLTETCVLITVLMINIEVTIVATSLVAITDDLQGFSKTSWIITGYLATYMGFMILWAKLSDIITRKTALILTMTIFTAFSGACGGAKSMTQLIIFRTFQGIGGAGGNSLTMLMTYEIVPKEKIPLYGAFISVTTALATLIGPLMGGAITEETAWRWVFYFNVPLGALAIALFIVALPSSFPYAKEDAPRRSFSDILGDMRRVDAIGAVLLLGGSLLLSTVLLDTSIRESWSAALTIILLVLAIVCWILFFLWERTLSLVSSISAEPMFPWHWIYDRPFLAMLLSNFLCGMPFNVVVVFLPQRLQTVSGLSALTSGIRLLPYTFSAAAGAGFAMVVSKRRMPVVFSLLIGATLQTIGLSLLSTLPNSSEWPAKGYGFEVLAGVGMGWSYGQLQLTTGIVMQGPDLASAAGAITQFRFLGGVIGLAIASNILSSRLDAQLPGLVPASVVHSVQESVRFLGSLAPHTRTEVSRVFADAYNLQNRAMIAVAALQIPVALLVWNRRWKTIA